MLSKNAGISMLFLVMLFACSLIARTTVSIVPSLGFVTALYAISVPAARALPRVLLVIS